MMSHPARLVLTLAFCCFLTTTAMANADGQDESATLAEAAQKALVAGRYADALSNFEQLAKLEPGVAEVHANLAIIYFKQREYELAVREVRAAQRLKPGLPKLESLLGLSLSELGQFPEALPRLEKGFRQTSDSEMRRMCGLQLLRAYTGLSRDGDAVATGLELNKIFPDDPEILYHTGRIYGNFAYVTMQKLHDRAPDSVWMLQAQAEANESQKDYEAAIIAFNHVLVLDPHRPGIHYRLGRVYLARFMDGRKPDDLDASQREFAAEVTVDPGNGNAGYELAHLQADLGNLDESRKLYEQVLERFPDFEEALVGLGGVCLDSKQPDQAIAALEHAIKLNPKDDVAWYRLARADRAVGNRDAQQKALAVFQQLSKAKPLHKPAVDEEITPQQLDLGTQP